ncbi:MAG: hypothetical protein WCO51_13460, partial [bacterium]
MNPQVVEADGKGRIWLTGDERVVFGYKKANHSYAVVYQQNGDKEKIMEFYELDKRPQEGGAPLSCAKKVIASNVGGGWFFEEIRGAARGLGSMEWLPLKNILVEFCLISESAMHPGSGAKKQGARSESGDDPEYASDSMPCGVLMGFSGVLGMNSAWQHDWLASIGASGALPMVISSLILIVSLGALVAVVGSLGQIRDAFQRITFGDQRVMIFNESYPVPLLQHLRAPAKLTYNLPLDEISQTRYIKVTMGEKVIYIGTQHHGAYLFTLLSYIEGMINGREHFVHIDFKRHPDNSLLACNPPTLDMAFKKHIQYMGGSQDSAILGEGNYVTALKQVFPGMRFSFLSNEIIDISWGGMDFDHRGTIIGSTESLAGSIASVDLDIFNDLENLENSRDMLSLMECLIAKICEADVIMIFYSPGYVNQRTQEVVLPRFLNCLFESLEHVVMPDTGASMPAATYTHVSVPCKNHIVVTHSATGAGKTFRSARTVIELRKIVEKENKGSLLNLSLPFIGVLPLSADWSHGWMASIGASGAVPVGVVSFMIALSFGALVAMALWWRHKSIADGALIQSRAPKD